MTSRRKSASDSWQEGRAADRLVPRAHSSTFQCTCWGAGCRGLGVSGSGGCGVEVWGHRVEEETGVERGLGEMC